MIQVTVDITRASSTGHTVIKLVAEVASLGEVSKVVDAAKQAASYAQQAA
jgi:hypothetical protein